MFSRIGMGIPGLGLARRAARMQARTSGTHAAASDVRSQVARKAEELSKALEPSGEAPLKSLRENGGGRPVILHAAVGWLLKEDRIEVVRGSGGFTVRLKR